MRILILRDKNLVGRSFDSIFEKLKVEYAVATSFSWEYRDFDFTGVNWIVYNRADQSLGIDYEFVKKTLKDIYLLDNLKYDHVIFLVSQTNWKNGDRPIGGWSLGTTYGNYAAEIVQAYSDLDWLHKVFSMEIAHSLDDLIYLELGISLSNLTGLNYDYDIVHGLNSNWGIKQGDGTYFTDYNYNKLIAFFSTYISQMYLRRETKYQDFLRGKIALLQQLVTLYRKLILLLGNQPKAIPQYLEKPHYH